VTSTWSSPDDALERVQAWRDAGRAAEALAEVQAALASFPDDALLHAVRSSLLVELARPSEAIAAAERAIALDPESGYAHTARARALLVAGTDPAAAAESAATGARLEPTDHAHYLLALALVEGGRAGEARQVAHTLRSQWPHSSLGPLVMSHLAMGQVRRLKWRSWPVVVACILASRGLALPFFGVRWAIISARNQPHLRRADQHLREALALDPHDADVRVMAAEVLRMRFRFVRAIDYELSAAALQAGLVDARELARGIARRLTIGIAASFFGWLLVVAAAFDILLPTRTAGVAGGVLALVAVAGLITFRRAQVGMLPNPLRRTVVGHVAPLLTAGVAIWWLSTPAGSYLDGGDGPRGYWLASLLALPSVAPGCLLLLTGFLRAHLRSP
jgi:tetratricopeptide (TPR) repeat protein